MNDSVAAPERPARATLGDEYGDRRNSLNFMRLVFAVTVIGSHAIGWGLFGTDNLAGGKATWGALAVFGFFGISGYLIAASATRNTLGRFLWQRALRIFPGYWVCLAVTVFLFGAIGFTNAPHPATCHAACYVDHTAVPYVADHWFFRYVNWHSLTLSSPWPWPIHGTIGANGQPVSNDSLWTLFYEFLCYLTVAALAKLGILRRRFLVLVMTVVLWIVEIVVALRPHQALTFDAMAILTLFPVFLSGSLIYLYRDKLPDSKWIALGCTAVFVASFWMPLGAVNIRPTSVDIFAPLMPYAVLWLGVHLPLQKVGARNDYSYGFYIYGMPITQLWANLGLGRLGLPLFALLCIAGTAPLAIASWWGVEKRCLGLKKLRFREVVDKLLGVTSVTGPVAKMPEPATTVGK